MTTTKRVVFIHPDLGIGGAERLVVDAGLATVRLGHSCVILTAHHTPSHCFPETLGPLLAVHCTGDFLPRHLLHRGYALFALIRMIYLALVCSIWYRDTTHVVVDQVAGIVPLLRILLPSTRVIFYCHYPDLLLSTSRTSILERAYRLPLDKLEAWATSWAHTVLVNSKFTGQVVRSTFGEVPTQVLYPCVAQAKPYTGKRSNMVLSLNRFERKKAVDTAVRAFAMAEVPDSQLVIAGGYDPRVTENSTVALELEALAVEYGLRVSHAPNYSGQVVFVKSCSESDKHRLLGECRAVVYTPEQEHFGIVPIEAMAAGRPVLACNSGGPRETVVHSHTGLLCNTVHDFAQGMSRVLLDPRESEELGRNGRQRVQECFSVAKFDQDWSRLYEQ